MTQELKILNISQLTARIKSLIDKSLTPVWIEGEISDFKSNPNGHVYLKLKDAGSKISAVFFDGAQIVNKLALANGTAVEAL
ncbi:MAG: exodeoxyribonuclease VII large subunit, partial [Lentisphaeria bacterium]|nr:exodeoxyribonuclease VII large subunit [Lentisphaeria bacterium]